MFLEAHRHTKDDVLRLPSVAQDKPHPETEADCLSHYYKAINGNCDCWAGGALKIIQMKSQIVTSNVKILY